MFGSEEEEKAPIGGGSRKISKDSRPKKEAKKGGKKTGGFSISNKFQVDFTQTGTPLPNPFETDKYGAPILGEKERAATSASSEIRKKPNWWEKIYDNSITDKWKAECKKQKIKQDDFEDIITELATYVSLHTEKIRISPVNGVWEADKLIDDKIKDDLMKQVAVLENVPDNEKDWHPGSNNQVLDLVHPSLYCFVNRVSPGVQDPIPLEDTIKYVGKGTPLSINFQKKKTAKDYSLSNDYQWLPSEFTVNEWGKVHIESYINNLHPIKHKEMYNSIERIFEKFVPMFERTINELNDKYGNGETIELNGQQLQVITKLANIVLTPGKNSKYNGGSWHVEGMKNERIVSTGIYYYHQENITESKLEFRQATDAQVDEEEVEEFEYEANMNQPSNDGGTATFEKEFPPQDLGYIVTQEDRCITFPNLYQHHVAPFELADKSKPGVRKILVFFLVDPTQKVVSTANVSPQQESWFEGAGKPENALMSLKDAQNYREKLMFERKYFVDENDNQFFNRYVQREVTLCEH